MKNKKISLLLLTLYFFYFLMSISLFSQEISITNGVQWLKSTQNPDGSWSTPPTDFTDTCEVTNTLHYLGLIDVIYSAAINWISGKTSVNTDELSRKIEVFANSGIDVTELVVQLVSYQNSDGGWGVAEGFSGDVLDTSLVLLALFSCNYSDSVVIGNGVNFILSQQNLDGSWGFEDEGEGNIYLTSLVLSVLQEYQSRLGIAYSELSKAINKGANWLLNKQNSDGSFGSSIFETSLSYSALIRTTYAPEQLQKTIEYIKNTQLDNGSWNNNAYETSLALRAIYDSLHQPVVLPDLTISSSDISFTKVNNQVVINAIIHNIGQQVAKNVVVQFYDGDPNNGGKQINNDILISNIYGQSKAIASLVCTLAYGTHQIYIVVDPYNTVIEQDETNNIAFNTYVETNEVLPDLSISSNDISFSNTQPKAGEEFTITAIVRNFGSADARGVVVQFYDGEPASGGKPLGQSFIVPSIPGDSYALLNLKLGLDEGLHNIVIVVDPSNTITETNEANNKSEKLLSVSSGPKTDLSISSEDITFSITNPKAGDTITAKAIIHNISSIDAKDVVVKFYDGDPKQGGMQLNKDWYISSIPKGSTASVEISFSLSSGLHRIYVWVDPYNTVAEENETNNIAYSQISVGEAPLPDVTINSTGITYEPTEPQSGQSVKLKVPIKNIGSGVARDVRVRLYWGLPVQGGIKVSGDLIINSIEPGETEIVPIGWCAEIGDHILTIILDPENEIAETDKSNNRSSITIHVVEGPPLPPTIPEEVQKAIDKGIEWLKSQQRPDGSIYMANWPLGETCLSIMAMLQGGVPRTDPVIQKALAYIEPISPSGWETYEIALKILAFQATGDKEKYFNTVQNLTNILINQYWLDGPFMYGDMSNTQYGVLALYAAKQWGIEIPQNVKEGLLNYVSSYQNGDGGWGYGLWWGPSYGSMTAAGIMDLRILGVPIEDSRIQRGLAWLNSHYSVTSNPGFGAAWGVSDLTWHYYYLYCLERAMEIPTTIEFIGTHNWYKDVSSYLVSVQQPDGRWTNPEEGGFWTGRTDILTTSWALLCLERAIPVKPFIDLEIKTDDITFSEPNPFKGVPLSIIGKIKNKGTKDASNVIVRFYDGDPKQEGRQIGEDQIIDKISAGSSNIVSISHIFTSDGIHSIYVVIDPLNLIEETRKDNNIANKDLPVNTDFSGTIDVTIDKTEYNAEEDVNIKVDIIIEQLVRGTEDIKAEVFIEDSEGNIVYSFSPISVADFILGQIKQYTLKWNTGKIVAGDYKVHGILKVGNEIKAEDYCLFKILAPEIQVGVTSKVATDKISYNPNEDVTIISKVKSNATNYTYTNLIIHEEITNPVNEIVWTGEREILSLLPGQDISLNFYWNTKDNIPGQYRVTQKLINSKGEIIDTDISQFQINSTLDTGKGISGTIKAIPEIVKQKTFDIQTTITNNGNVDLTNIVLEKLIIDPETKQIVRSYQETISYLIKGETKTSVVSGISILGLSVKDYILILNTTFGGKTYPLAIGHVKIVDIQSPRTTINISLPKYIAETIFITSTTEFTLTAIDDLIEVGDGIGLGVDYSEYKIDNTNWIKYTGAFTILNEGTHTISYRSADVVGNMEETKTLNICVDNTPPVINIASPIDGKEYFNNETIPLQIEVFDTYSGVAWYKVYLDGNEITGQNTITGVVGLHNLKVVACDNLGHQAEKQITFMIKLLATIRIEPESFNKNIGEFTAFIKFPEGYDTSTIRNTFCDGAPGIKYNYSPGQKEMIINFRRNDITELPLDIHFVVRGIFGDNLIFEGWDDIKKIEE